MKIGVLGGGALGMLYGGAFSETYPTTIYTRTEEQARKITQNGLLLSIGTKRKKLFPAALVSGKLASSQSIDILFVALKSYQLLAVMPLLRQLPAHTVLCFLSNGIGHLAYLNDLPARTVIVATSEHGAVREQLNQLDWRGMGKTNYSYYRQIREDTVMLDAFFEAQTEFIFQKHADYRPMLFRKLIANSCINPLTAIWQVNNGQLIEVEGYRRILKVLVTEVEGVLGLTDQWEQVVAICRGTAENFSSMATDIANQRPTEADSILKPILEMATEKGIGTPLLELIYEKIIHLERKS